MRLDIKGLEVKLQKQDILHKINLRIESGEFVSLLGPSGCGKTTLLKSIAGLISTERGEIWIADRRIDRMEAKDRGTVIVFQDLRLFPHMTVEKNISFAMDIRGTDKNEKAAVTAQLLEDVHLSGYGKRRIKELSGGQMQRVALARALAAAPEILLLDEPFSGLDEELRAEMGELVRKLQRKKRITTLLVTHDREEAVRLSDRIAVMEEGSIVKFE